MNSYRNEHKAIHHFAQLGWAGKVVADHETLAGVGEPSSSPVASLAAERDPGSDVACLVVERDHVEVEQFDEQLPAEWPWSAAP